MKLFEFDTDELETALYNPASDRLTARHLGDTRRPVVTLRKINKLKKMRALRQMEKLKHQDLLDVMYAQPDDQGGGAGPMGF